MNAARITIYLRAVSTSSGRILKNVYVSKTILSQGISANLFRYVDIKRLLEVETGVTKNEPAQLAVKEAIDKAVEVLIVEGIIDGLWVPKGGEETIKLVKEKYLIEKEELESTALLDRKLEDRRGKFGLSISGGTALIDGDYSNPKEGIAINSSMKIFLKNPNLSLNLGMGYFRLENEQIFKEGFVSLDTNLEYNLLPYDSFSPFIYAGLGVAIPNPRDIKLYTKFQYGLGLEYLPVNNIGIKIFGEQNLMFNDKLDLLVNGKRNDYFWRFGVGLNIYIGKPYKSVKSKIFE